MRLRQHSRPSAPTPERLPYENLSTLTGRPYQSAIPRLKSCTDSVPGIQNLRSKTSLVCPELDPLSTTRLCKKRACVLGVVNNICRIINAADADYPPRSRTSFLLRYLSQLPTYFSPSTRCSSNQDYSPRHSSLAWHHARIGCSPVFLPSASQICA